MKIRTKLILLTSSLVLLSIVPISFIVSKYTRESIVTETYNVCQNLSKLISSFATEELILNSTFESTTKIVNELKENKINGLLNLYILNRNGEYVVAMDTSLLGKVVDANDLDYFRANNELTLIEKQDKSTDILQYSYPIIIELESGKLKVGIAVFEFEKNTLFQPVKRLQQIIFYSAATSIVIGILASFLVAGFFSKPIHELLAGIRIISSGNLEHTIGYKSSDEIGILATEFNTMTLKIREANYELKGLNENLEKKVIERTNQVNEMLKQLGTLYLDSENKRKEIESLAESRLKLSLVGQMAAGIVHDIKNPMATIKYLAEMLNSEEVTIETRTDNLNLIVREMDRLSDLAYEILDFSKGKLNLDLQELNLKNFIFEIEKFLAMDFEYLGVKCILDLRYEGNISIDKDRMRRVIVNLAKNAMEAMYDGKKEYSLTIRSEKKSPEGITISLIDNGPGIPESVQERIFQAFATEGKAKGTGLGLFMCKWIVEAHNGELTYETKRGEGTTFFIHLPQS